MLQERPPGVTVEFVQALAIALLVGFVAVAVLACAVLGYMLARARIAAASLRAWYSDIATKRVIADHAALTRRETTPAPAPAPKAFTPPAAPTPRPPPLPALPNLVVGPPRRPKPRLELAQTSPDWSDDARATKRFARPGEPPEPDGVTDEQLDFGDLNDPPPRRP